MKIAKDGLSIILSFLTVAILFYLAGIELVAALFLVFAVFCIFFFRDPDRRWDKTPGSVCSPADGTIMSISDTQLDGNPATHVVIFLSVFNVHINRIPFDGTVVDTRYVPGKFAAAMKPNIDKINERMEITLETEKGRMKLVQIAGLIARRIVCRVRSGDTVKKGDRFGLIKFSSRTDLILPKSATICVKPGDKVQGAKTVIAKF